MHRTAVSRRFFIVVDLRVSPLLINVFSLRLVISALGLREMISSGSATGRYELHFRIPYKQTGVHR